MKGLKPYNLKILLSKAFLAGILFFSFIAIAGYSGNSRSTFRQNGQTELICSTETPGVRNTSYYPKKLRRKEQKPFLSHCCNLISLLVYNRLVKTCFQTNLKEVYSISIPGHFFPIAKTTQISGENPSPSLAS